MLILAFIAALMGAPSWVAFWCVVALLTGHKHPILLALPLIAGLVGEPAWAAISILVIWAHGVLAWLTWVGTATQAELDAHSDRVWGKNKVSSAQPTSSP